MVVTKGWSAKAGQKHPKEVDTWRPWGSCKVKLQSWYSCNVLLKVALQGLHNWSVMWSVGAEAGLKGAWEEVNGSTVGESSNW